MKISIITVSFNSAQTICDSIDSVLSQNYGNIEYIIIDGESTDGTIDLINGYGDRVSKFISESDTGIYDAMNKGISLATGDVIGILNSDDFYTEGAILKLVENINSQAVLYYAIQGHCHEDGSHSRIENIDENITFDSILNGKSVTSQPGSFYEKEALEKIGFLDESLKFVMDTDLWLKLLQYGKPKFIPYVMAYLRAHNDSKSCNKKISDIRESQQVFRKYGGNIFSLHYLRGKYAIYTNFFRKKYK